MTLKLSGQIINFLSFFGLSKKTTSNIEVCPESFGSMLEFDVSNVAYSLDLKLCTYMLLLTLTQSILKKRDVNAGTFLSLCCLFILILFHGQLSSLFVFRYLCCSRVLYYCFSLLLLLYLRFINLVQSQLTCYSLPSFLRKI